MNSKKIIVLTLVYLSFLYPKVFSAPCYGSKMPQKKHIFTGFQTHNIIKRKLEKDYGKLRSLQHFFLLSYGVTDWFSIDLKIGEGYIKEHPAGADEIDYPSSFAGGYGFRIKLLDNKDNDVRAVFGFQHISVHPYTVHVNEVKHQAVLDDWQASLLVSKKIKSFTPYMGVKFSRVDYIHWINENRKRDMSDLTKTLDLVTGFDIPFFMESWLNIEAQFLGGKAGSFAIMYSF